MYNETSGLDYSTVRHKKKYILGERIVPITDQAVLDAFDSFGDNNVQGMALQMKLRDEGFVNEDIVNAINSLLSRGILTQNRTGSICRA
jgi:hypothetical protein